ncbi:MAG TPA: ABC transporter ATP-binding protein [Acidobacteriota bacterium]
MQAESELIKLDKITKHYRIGREWFPALSGISHVVKRGEFVAIMGPSGSGKSTLMSILGCLDGPTAGDYFLNGKNVSELSENQRTEIRNKEIGFVFQAFNLIPRTTTLENIELPLLYGNVRKKVARAKALEKLKLVGLEDKKSNRTNQISGGEMQRVAIARALANDPPLILADEPTGNLDTKRSNEIMDFIRMLNREKGITVIMVTHEPDIGSYAQRRIHMRDGLIERQD